MSDSLMPSNETEQVSLFDDFIVMKTVADVTCLVCHWLLFNPTTTFIVATALYILFVIIFAPFLLLSYVISSVGSFLLFVLILCLAARTLSRTMAFAGSNLGYQRSIAADFLRRICEQLNQISYASSDLMSTMLLSLNGREFSTHTGQSMEQRYEYLLKHSTMLSHLSSWLSTGKSLIVDGMLPEDKELFIVFLSSVEDLGEAQDTISKIFSSSNSRFPFQDILNDEQKSTEMCVAVGKALQDSENLKATLIKVLPHSDEANEEGENSDVKIAMKQVTELLSFQKGPVGLERISYPIMREQLKFKYGASRYSVLGEDGNVIDAVWIPCVHPKGGPGGTATNRSGDALPNTDPSTRHRDSVSSSTAVGTVLFCCPNAGLYECMAQVDPQSSWLGYYHAQSFDVCMFNYRGYNDSTGIPTPARLKSDGISVVNYLYDELHIHGGLIVHGESMGGMVACHIARHYTKHTPLPFGLDVSHFPGAYTKKNPIMMLVCDRSFGSLDAVAASLVGSWTSYALRYISHWDTGVVDDYLHTSCAKVILQDPRDEMIADGVGLKTCVATRLLLQDTLHLSTALSRCYGIHDYVATFPSCSQGSTNVGDRRCGTGSSNTLYTTLPSCVGALFQDVDYSALPPTPPVGGSAHSQANNVLPVSEQWIQHFTSCIISIGRRTVVYPSAGGGHGGGARRSSQQPPRLSHGSSTSNTQHGLQSPTHSDYSSIGSSRSRSNSRDNLLDVASKLEEGLDNEQEKRIVLRKVWNLLVKMDGGVGQLLGQCLAVKHLGKGLAVGASLNSVRTWICNCIVWNQPLEGNTSIQCMTTDNVLKWKRNLDSTYYPAGCRYHVLEVIHQLKMLLPSLGAGVIDVECSFVLNALEHMVELNKQCASMTAYDRFVNSSGDDCEEGFISRTTAECNWISSNYDPSYCSNRSNSSGYPISSLLGQVIPVHAGHSGWLSAEELSLFTSVLRCTVINGVHSSSEV